MRTLIAAALLFPTLASAGAAKEGREFLERYEALAKAFDPAFIEMYRDDAIITVTQVEGEGQTNEREVTGLQFKEVWLGVRGLAQRTGDYSEYSNVSVKKRGDKLLVTAVRNSVLKCTTDSDFSMTLTRTDGDSWVIFRMHSKSWSYSMCPDAPPPAHQRAAFVVSMVSEHLPLVLDNDTVLETLSAEEATLRYGLRLVNISSLDDDIERLSGAIAQAGHAQACSDPTIGQLLSIGITVEHHYQSNDDVEVAGYTVTDDSCVGQ